MKTLPAVGQIPLILGSPTLSESASLRAAWAAHVARSACTPPAENSDTHEVALVGKDGQGACTLPWAVASQANLDSSGLRMVRKGSVVRFFGGSTAVVARVRLGRFWTVTGASLGSDCFHHCTLVDVL